MATLEILKDTEGTCQHQGEIDGLRQALSQALVGKAEVIEFVLASLLARGHILFDDLPGLGKTTLAKAIASAVGGKFGRVQCTPDLLPSDITGFNIFNQKTHEFEFREGPTFSDVLLADEINRTTPRTQSALFEAMAERQVSIDGRSYALSPSFFVLATQNPVESHGTYPLPEAQLDRFSMKLQIGYPDRTNEIELLSASVGRMDTSRPPTQQVINPHQLQLLQQHVATVAVSPVVQGYLVDLARATREHSEIEVGLSPRSLLIWQRVAQAWAHLQRRDFVIPDDVQKVANPVLQVRLVGRFDDSTRIIEEILGSVPVPVFSPARGKG